MQHASKCLRQIDMGRNIVNILMISNVNLLVWLQDKIEFQILVYLIIIVLIFDAIASI